MKDRAIYRLCVLFIATIVSFANIYLQNSAISLITFTVVIVECGDFICEQIVEIIRFRRINKKLDRIFKELKKENK